MIFLEAERMAYGLFEPDECESERTVIISELQGGENDPEQVSTRKSPQPRCECIPTGIRPSDGFQDLHSMTRDDSSVITAAITIRRTPRWWSSATWIPKTCSNERSVISAAFSGPRERRKRPAEPPQLGERRVLLEREGTTACNRVSSPGHSRS